MASFLTLCQRVVSDSGTIEGTFPTAVTGQTGRLLKAVRWTNTAWESIQNAHASWRWMAGEFSGSTVATQIRYTPTQLSIASRFGEWGVRGVCDERYSIYKTATGVSDEAPLLFMPWDEFYVRRLKGTLTSNRPNTFSISPANEFCLSPTPDAVYTVRGPYRKSAQDLAADADIPEMPTRFHNIIVDAALDMLGAHDEAMSQIPLWRLRKVRGFSDLERDQLPPIQLAGALA